MIIFHALTILVVIINVSSLKIIRSLYETEKNIATEFWPSFDDEPVKLPLTSTKIILTKIQNLISEIGSETTIGQTQDLQITTKFNSINSISLIRDNILKSTTETRKTTTTSNLDLPFNQQDLYGKQSKYSILFFEYFKNDFFFI
jgi:hypothetical protein